MEKYEKLIICDDLHITNAFQTLNIFRENAELTDVILRTENGFEMPAHKVVLSACSPYFRAMFTTDFLEARKPCITLKNFDGIALRDILDYFYSGKLVVHESNVEEIVKLANLLQLDRLIERCEVYLRRNMTPKNSLGLQAFAKHYSLSNLEKHATRYSCWYFHHIKDEEEFLLLPFTELKLLLDHNGLRGPSEEFIFEALMNWILYDPSNRTSHIPELLQLIRFPLMCYNYLANSNTVNYLVENFAVSQSFIQEAIKYQQQQLAIQDETLPKRFTPRTCSEDIYVIGGWSNGQKLSTVQCFSVDTLQWTTVMNMNVAHVSREDYFRVIVSNEELYTICYDKVMKYDPVDGTWQKFAPGPEVQCKWAGVCEYDGHFFVIGGNSSKTSKQFVTSTGEWKDLPPMNMARYYPGIAVMNKNVYVIGGLDNCWHPSRNCERFDPIKNVWEPIARLRSPRWSLGVAVLRDRLFAIGGSHNVEQFANTVEIYDPITDIWERSIAPMNYGRRCLGVAVVNDLIYVVGGRVASTIECYDENANSWNVVGSVPTCCSFGCVALRII